MKVSRVHIANAADEHAIQTAIDTVEPPAALGEWFRSYGNSHKSRLAIDLHLLERLRTPNAEVVEFGAVPPILTHALTARSISVTAVDIDPNRFAESFNRIPANVVRHDIERTSLPFDDESFDIALFNELFEHLRINPIFTLSEVLRILKPGGIILMSTPNLRSLNGLKSFLLHNRGAWCAPDVYDEYSKLDTLGHMGHVREYTTREVEEFLTRIGFEPMERIYRDKKRRRADPLFALFPGLSPFVTYVARRPKTR